MTHFIRFVIIAIFVFPILMTGCKSNNEQKNVGKSDLPLCEDMNDIIMYNGKQVKLVGKIIFVDAGKTWVTHLVLKSGSSLVYDYSKRNDLLEEYGDNYIVVTGTVYKSYPPSDEPVQMLSAPHIVDARILGIE